MNDYHVRFDITGSLPGQCPLKRCVLIGEVCPYETGVS